MIGGNECDGIDKNLSDEIEWLTDSTIFTPDGATEAIFFAIDETIVSSEFDVDFTPTLQALDTRIDTSLIAAGEGFLIVVHNLASSGTALLHFTESDGNHHIDAGEVELIAMFTGGAPEMEQITLVGLPG